MKRQFNLSGIRPDNESYYFSYIEGLTEFVDREASIQVNPASEAISIAIVPSVPETRQDIIGALLSIHKILGIKTDFSKSTNIQKSIVYQIKL